MALIKYIKNVLGDYWFITFPGPKKPLQNVRYGLSDWIATLNIQTSTKQQIFMLYVPKYPVKIIVFVLES